ncbi:hypothetical protein OF83DRAFT_1178649 [Amylostereum chailletii]|nr:hypothetical protein OF83DRAFT_1178649 [Amylostereum chailletii]
MPSPRPPVASYKKQASIRARFFHESSDSPLYVQVPVMIPHAESSALPHFPAVEALLGTRTVVHDTWVTVTNDHERLHRFLLSSTVHMDLIANYALRAHFPDLPGWPGDIVVMAIGGKRRVVGIRGEKQASLADEAVHKYVLRVFADWANDPTTAALLPPTDV